MVRMRTLIPAGVLCLAAGSAHALPLVNVEAGARYWNANPSGDAAYKGADWDVQDDMGFDKEWTPSFYARAAIPFVTLEAEYTDLSYSGSTGTISRKWGSQTYSTKGRDTSLDMTLTHAGAMFSVPLPFVHVGVGVGATQFDVQAKVGNDESKFNGTLPVAEAEARVNFPALPLMASVKANGVAYNGDSYRDITAEVGFVMGLLQVRGGYRTIALNYDDNQDRK
ncbi:MAG TPA: hypothetical protein VKA48_11910, partial [Gammaproteobacteria bacterium]|nr:hypothetical protein [Gammaproteobacteria bacterium]